MPDSEESDDPLALFAAWLAEAGHREPNDPTAAALATATADGAPSLRMVLVKGCDANGFVFYTNTLSRKGRQLAGNPRAALLFHWKTLRRQVRIEGAVETVGDAQADAYFATRPRLSRLGAWASLQSQPLSGRAELEARMAAFAEAYPDERVPRPPHWSGYRVVPARIEFWRDIAHRLHDRVLYVRAGDRWATSRLYP